MSSKQNERTLRGRGGPRKRTRMKKGGGGGGSKLGNHERTYFLNVPKKDFNKNYCKKENYGAK